MGAWHGALGFTPYGGSISCANIFGNYAHYTPMPSSPESVPPSDAPGSSLANFMLDVPGENNPDISNIYHSITKADGGYPGRSGYIVGYADGGQFHNPPISRTEPEVRKELISAQGTYSRGFLVVAYEGELALVAKKDRDGITAVGDYLKVAQTGTDSLAGTTEWSERIHNQDRFVCTANAGPNVEALIAQGTEVATASLDYEAENVLQAAPFDAEMHFHPATSADASLGNATPCRAPTGDLFFDIDKNIGGIMLENNSVMNRNTITGEEYISNKNESPDTDIFGATGTTRIQENTFWIGDVHAQNVNRKSPAKNFNVENIVWKRMDGGSLTLPASNARGLGGIPWITRVISNTPYVMGEKIYGNVRFSFETTNTAMMPILQAQEIAHPQLAEKHPTEMRNVLNIPNEELQFQDVTVVDDTGQTHTLEGGSPLGVIIRGFAPTGERDASGLQPSPANSGLSPNLEIQLPDPDSIPGNILVRSGFDRLQAYQNETMGDGGMIHPDLGGGHIGHLFEDGASSVLMGPRGTPTQNEVGWEHISKGENFPDSTTDGWLESNNHRTLQSSYEQHDRTLYFHITKMGNSHTERYPTIYSHDSGAVTQDLKLSTYADGNITANASITTAIFDAGFGSKEVADNRRFLRISNSDGDSVIVSYTSIGTGGEANLFKGVVGDIDFDQFLLDNPITNTLTIVPSYYIPAGSARLFAARRLRDHAEVSGNSPDMAHTLYFDGSANTFLYARYSKPQLTPMPYPRMGHHYVNATMPMMPGHWAHPAYQGLYDKHRDEYRATLGNEDFITLKEYTTAVLSKDTGARTDTIPIIADEVKERLFPLNPYLRFGALNASPSGPSDVHGGGFTLMFESKIRHDGYGILASKGEAGNMNKTGGHSIVLEAAANYTLDNHFPDPAEVGAYQIVIQPNLKSQQIGGFHLNNASATGFPDIATPANNTAVLTNQQVNLVIGVKYDTERHSSLTNAANVGGLTLILAEATMADVRGCEIFINEIMLDHDPDHMGQFTNIPPLSVFNPFGVQGSESPAFTRTAQPYHHNMFIDATPGYTLNIPWWSIIHRVSPDDATSTGFRHLSIYRLDSYYQFCRGTHGSIAAQITLGGYPTISPDIYSRVMNNVSLTPTCVVIGGNATTISVDDASFFPETPLYGQKLIYTDPTTGVENAIEYTERMGIVTSTYLNAPKQFTKPTGVVVPTGVTLRLSRAYSNSMNSELFNKSSSSVMTRILPQLVSGTRDTNSLYVGDAYLCAWHPNLGKPNTFYSDSSRTWGTPTSDRAVDNAAYNHIPEHYETIHYQDVNYAASLGPFGFGMMTPTPNQKTVGLYASGATAGVGSLWDITTNNSATATSGVATNHYIYSEGKLVGKVSSVSSAVIRITEPPWHTPAVGADIWFFKPTATNPQVSKGSEIHSLTGYVGQASDTKMLSHYWPCGSRGGPLVSRLDGWATTVAGWHRPRLYTDSAGTYWKDADDDNTGSPKYQLSSGLTTVSAGSIANRPYPFGYRFGLRQAWNRPQWGLYGMRAFEEKTLHSGGTTHAVGYKAGPLTHYESQTWTYTGGSGSGSNSTLGETYVGILERQTTAAGMLNDDKTEAQVRYSEGARMTRPFGCPVRTLRNHADVIRDWWGDDNGKQLDDIEDILPYYIVDWWGNTRGEDVRKPPVRGFGVRPAWDAGDAYEYDRANGRTPHQRLWNNGKPIYNTKGVLDASNGNVSVSGTSIPRFGGRLNNGNNNSATTLVDVFVPTNALRIGDMGNGRGVRFPTQFNEDRLVELSAVYENAGVVLSANTAEPAFGDGYLRPRNDVLSSDEITRGISNRLEVEEDGLLKPEAVVSDRVESIVGTSVHKDVISRSSPRIGIDGESLESYGQGTNRDMIAINTEAHSLHTDKGVGQRIILQGGLTPASQTLGDYDLTSLSFAAQPHGGVMRFSHTNNMKSYGGNYIMETRSYVSPFDDTGWGRGAKLTGTQKTSNPYENEVYGSNIQTNYSDLIVRFLLRPVRVLDNKHVSVFRPMSALHSDSKQYQADYYSATAGGKYGLFSYEATNGRADSHGGSTAYMRTTNPNANAPYQPVYLMESSSATVPVAKGPKLLGTEVANYDKTSLKSSVTRLIISENTLQHYRSDAPRRNINGKDFSVKPRFSQSLHSKGHKEDVNFNTSTHIGDA